MARNSFAMARIRRLLTCTYQRQRRLETADDPATPTTDESTDAWGNPQESFAAADLDTYPCRYSDVSSVEQGEEGPILIETPTLTIAGDDDLEIGDLVLNVLAADGTLLLAGPAVVENPHDSAPAGVRVYRTVLLRLGRAPGADQ